MFVLIAGGGRTAEQLASLLLAQDHQVMLIEQRPEVLALLHKELPTEAIYEGDFTDPEVLRLAGIERAEVLAACTDSDPDNLVLCHYARALYGVRRTIARVNNPRNAWLFDDTFDVDAALNQPQILAALIEEQMSPGELVTLLKLQRGRYSILEEKILPGSKVVGVALKDLGLPEECVIAAVIRDGDMIMPRGNMEFAAGDEVLAIADREGAQRLAALFGVG